MRTTLAIAAVSLLAATPALAQDRANVEGFYLGVGLGDFSTGIDDIEDVDDADLDFDSDENARKLFAGWRFNRFVGVQVDFIDFERSTAATELLNISADAKGFAPSIVGTLPLGPVELFARAGVLWYDLSIDSSTSSLVDDSDRDPIFGAGVGFTVAQRVNLRAEYEVVDIEGLDDSHAVWITAAWRF